MSYTRREFGKLALASLPAAAILARGDSIFGAFAQAKPNSLIDGVQIGTITYSFRSMPDQSAEATLKYIVDSGISAIELMGGPVESFAGAPASADGRGAARGQGARGSGRGAAERPDAAAAAPIPEGARKGDWKGHECVIPSTAAAGAAAGRGGRGRGELTPEQQDQANRLKAWRTTASMDGFKKLRTMYNDAGVTIYAWKQLSPNMSNEELEYVFDVAETLGCTHTTLELPTDTAQLKRIGDFAAKKKIYAAYHTHTQGGMNIFDKAFPISKGNMANVDFGHWTAGGNVGGSQMEFLNKYHDRISS